MQSINTPEELHKHFCLVFQNAMTYNHKKSDIYVMAQQLDHFATECRRRFPLPLLCSDLECLFTLLSCCLLVGWCLADFVLLWRCTLLCLLPCSALLAACLLADSLSLR